ncbi:MAG: hypothetical protein IJY67_07635 [Paludibacteraceae bacterium]|nr:hypothetical protein [Paludibacteraceae bacterium]
MKNELLQYSQVSISYIATKEGKRSVFFSDKTFAITVIGMLLVSCLPLILDCIWLVVLLCVVYIGILLYSSHKDDSYANALVLDGIIITSSAISSSYLLLSSPTIESGRIVKLALIVTTMCFLLIHESFVLIKMLKRKYTIHKQQLDSVVKHQKRVNLSATIGFAGVGLSGLSSMFLPYSMTIGLLIGFVSWISVSSFSYIQKYVIYKILCSRVNKN